MTTQCTIHKGNGEQLFKLSLMLASPSPKDDGQRVTRHNVDAKLALDHFYEGRDAAFEKIHYVIMMDEMHYFSWRSVLLQEDHDDDAEHNNNIDTLERALCGKIPELILKKWLVNLLKYVDGTKYCPFGNDLRCPVLQAYTNHIGYMRLAIERLLMRQERALAFAMVTHPRLGTLSGMSDDVLRFIILL